MGYTSTIKEVSWQEAQALIAGKDLTEASQIKYFSMAKYHLARLFSFAEICSNGKIILRDHMKIEFAAFERRG